jgi:hypothetical protein
MADNSKRVSELPVTTNVASTDRVLVLRDPSGAPSVRTITVNNFISNVAASIATTAANLVNTSAATAYSNAVAYANSILTSNLVNYPTKTQLQANLTSTSLSRSMLTISWNNHSANSSQEVFICRSDVSASIITVTLPVDGSISNGKIYTVKCASNGDLYKTTVTTLSPNRIENLSNGVFTTSVDLANSGSFATWIFDNGYYRRIG